MKSIEKKYPSVHLAYEIAMKSYDEAMKRSDVADDAIDKLRSWITTVNLAFIAWMLPRLSVNLWFVISIAIFVLIIVLSVLAKSRGALLLPSPRELYNKYLHWSEWEFKKNMTYWAAEHFEKNKAYVAKKARYIVIIFTLFLLEVETMVSWVLAVHH